TLLIRYLVRADLEAQTRRIALLYAVNTAGAASGCFLTDFTFVPAWGLLNTQLIAVSLNVIAGAGAIALVRLKADPTEARKTGPTESGRTGLSKAKSPESGGGRARKRKSIPASIRPDASGARFQADLPLTALAL